MANNSNRKAIEFMVQGALPPHSTNVLWMDTSVPTLPVLKIFENGAWTTVHTGEGKAIELLSQTVLAQQNEITELTEDISSKMALDATVAKEATLQAVEQNVSAAKEAAQALVPVAAAAEAYNTGKVQLAQNITAKGVQASATETLPELAEKVSAISQETYEINGGEMYAKQLSGSLTTPNYWNLYEVLANLLSDGRLVSYGGILLAEYYRGYDSLTLAGAGAGGGYVVSDKDENGNFIMYTNDTTHIWNEEWDGKLNRWVAYCFADADHDFEITDTNTSPRSIFIGRKVGKIDFLTNSQTSQIVVMDGNSLASIHQGSYSSEWDKKMIIRGMNNLIVTSTAIKTSSEFVYLEFNGIVHANDLIDAAIIAKSASVVYVKAHLIGGNSNSYSGCAVIANENKIVVIDAEKVAGNVVRAQNNNVRLSKVYFLNVEEMGAKIEGVGDGGVTARSNYVYIGYKTNSKDKTINCSTTASDIELQEGFCKNLIISSYNYRDINNLLTEENMYAHILQRLKQDEPNCGDGVTITLGSTNLAKLTSQESQDLLAELRGTYGYTFA